MSHSDHHSSHSLKDPAFWIPGFAEFLIKHPVAEAIRFDPVNRKLAIATLGEVDTLRLEAELSYALRSIEMKKNQGSQENETPYSLRKEKRFFILEKPSCQTAPQLYRWHDIPWPSQKEAGCCEHAQDWRLLAGLSAACGIFGLLGYIFEVNVWGPDFLALSCYVIAFFTGAWDALGDIIKKVPRGEFDIHFLMVMVAIAASAIGAWREGALLLFLFSGSGAMEAFAMHRTQKSIDALFKKAPQSAWRILASGEEEQIAIDAVMPGDLLRVRPGELFPVDALILEGESAADESNLTGESLPVDKKKGDTVSSGTLNLWGSLSVQAKRRAEESSFQKIIRLIQEAQHLKAPSQRFTDRFGTRYTFAILLLTLVMFFIWYLGFGVPPFRNTAQTYSAFYRAMTLLVVASPCALVLSIPSAILAGIAWGAMRGVLFRGGAAIERLAEVNCVALDKTGTLTTGELAVESIESYPAGNEEEVLRVALSLESHASHPLARAIVRHARHQGLEAQPVDHFKSLTGLGVEGTIGRKKVLLGRKELLPQGAMQEGQLLSETGPEYSEVWVMTDSILGRILLKDKIRLESAPVLKELEHLKIETLMLTGDRQEIANTVAGMVGLKDVRAGLSPEGKVDVLQSLKASGKIVAMLGDGVNDAPSLAAADVAIAMGAKGSDAALEQSELVLMNDRIDLFLCAYRLSRYAKTIIKQNLTISILTIVCMILSSMMGIVPLTVGVLAHEGSTFLVCLNSLRILIYHPKNCC